MLTVCRPTGRSRSLPAGVLPRALAVLAVVMVVMLAPSFGLAGPRGERAAAPEGNEGPSN